MNSDEASLRAAREIEDIFTQDLPGAEVQRRARIQARVCAAIEEATRSTAQYWRNDALEKAADIARRYESNPHCVLDILAMRGSDK